MKFILTILICSQVAGTCLPPYQVPEKFDDGYDCMITGYEMALDKLQEMGREDVNKHNIFINDGNMLPSCRYMYATISMANYI